MDREGRIKIVVKSRSTSHITWKKKKFKVFLKGYCIKRPKKKKKKKEILKEYFKNA